MDYCIPGIPTGIAWKPHFEMNAGCSPGVEPHVYLWCSTIGLLMSSSVHICNIRISWNFRVYASILLYPSCTRRDMFLKMLVSFHRCFSASPMPFFILFYKWHFFDYKWVFKIMTEHNLSPFALRLCLVDYDYRFILVRCWLYSLWEPSLRAKFWKNIFLMGVITLWKKLKL